MNVYVSYQKTVQLYYLIIVLVWSLFCVCALAGQVYERRLIEKYIQENGRDPISKVNTIGYFSTKDVTQVILCLFMFTVRLFITDFLLRSEYRYLQYCS